MRGKHTIKKNDDKENITINIKNKTNNNLPPLMSNLFYLYFALLPLLAFASLYFEKDIWNNYTHIIYSGNITAYFSYHIFCASAFFLSAILSLLLIQNTPLPKKKWLALIIIFDAPIILLLDYITGNKVSIAEMAIYDFTIELLSFIIADIILSFKTKHTILIPATIFTIALLSSYYGLFTFNILKNAGLKSILLISFTFFTTTTGYYNVLKLKDANNNMQANNFQVKMSKVGTVAMFTTWLLIIYVYGKTFL